jgi:hypothetical protein
MSRVRSLLAFKLGAIAGMLSAAAFVKGARLSRGNEQSDELSLVAILDGIDLTNRASAFKGGSLLAWFGGISVDLREAELASDARLCLRTFYGGIAIKTPPHWRLESHVRAVAGGVDVRGSADEASEAPVLTLDGVALFGGIAVGASAGQ